MGRILIILLWVYIPLKITLRVQVDGLPTIPLKPVWRGSPYICTVFIYILSVEWHGLSGYYIVHNHTSVLVQKPYGFSYSDQLRSYRDVLDHGLISVCDRCPLNPDHKQYTSQHTDIVKLVLDNFGCMNGNKPPTLNQTSLKFPDGFCSIP